MAKQPMLKFVTVAKDMPEKRAADIRSHDFHEIYREFAAQKAAEQHATVEDYAFTSGCRLILQTAPGEKYQGPDGSWQTRGGGAPIRDSRCP